MSLEKPRQESFTIGDLLVFVKVKRDALLKNIAGREQMRDSWSKGTSVEWRKVKCKMTKAQRMEEAGIHGAIALAQRREVAMFDAVIDVLSRCQL